LATRVRLIMTNDKHPLHSLHKKLQLLGAGQLTDQELAMLLLGEKSSVRDIKYISAELIHLLEEEKDDISLKKLSAIKGISKNKALLMTVALEIARRKLVPSTQAIYTSLDVYRHVSYMADRDEENFLCLTLNAAQEVIKTHLITKGLVNKALVHPREVFRAALNDKATAIIVAHNHPSGDVTPSDEDRDVTARLLDAGRLMGVPLLDHVIFSKEDLYSFLDNNDFD
jgi:DNA repair protein RadC